MEEASFWVFDNDGTLYSSVKPIEERVVELMIDFIAGKLRIPPAQATKVRHGWMSKHNTRSTLIAAMREGLDPREFLEATYLAVDVAKFVRPSILLQQGLLRLGGAIN